MIIQGNRSKLSLNIVKIYERLVKVDYNKHYKSKQEYLYIQ